MLVWPLYLYLSKDIFQEEKKRDLSLHREEYAAVSIQRYWRGFKGRQIYVSKLYEQFEKVSELLLTNLTLYTVDP